MNINHKQIDYLHDGISSIELVGVRGTELDIVNAARVSFHNESMWKHTDTSKSGGVLNDRDKGLINFLMREKHGTPFEMGFQATFRIRMPIFVAREHVRHRIGHSINEESGRYVEMRPDFYIPKRVREQEGKPGAYTFVDTEDDDLEYAFKRDLTQRSKAAYNLYKGYLDAGVAKEQARMFLPLNLYTEMLWTCNARSLMNYLSLRAHKDAQLEIRKLAYAIEDIFKEYMPNTWESFEKNGREAP
jgi:thymidylate synthase (FAD)